MANVPVAAGDHSHGPHLPLFTPAMALSSLKSFTPPGALPPTAAASNTVTAAAPQIASSESDRIIAADEEQSSDVSAR
jgi:hypothetical protein